MLNSNAVLSRVIRIQPPPERAPAEAPGAGPELFVELEDGRRARLDPADPRSPGFLQVLDGLSKLRQPVYLELDAATSAIRRLLIPHVSRPVGLSRLADGALSIELELSHGRHVLPRSAPDFGELEKQLAEALRGGEPVILTEDDAHNVFDVRAFRPGPDDGPLPPGPGPKFPWPPDPIRNLIERWLLWPWWPWRWRSCLSMARAQEIFEAMSATSCAPLTVPPPCIPFLYPDDGCWGRAHEMCRLMIAQGLAPRKVWSEGDLRAPTRNNPDCFVEWGWHVAPTLCVRGPGIFQTRRMVIDPALFTTPVSTAIWKGAQGDPSATLTDTAASLFHRYGSSTDPGYVLTNQVLATYRLRLQNRSNQIGAPPYANCP